MFGVNQKTKWFSSFFFLDCWAGKLLKFCWEFVSSHLQRPVHTNSAMWGRPVATLKGASWRACATQRSSAGKELTDSACATMAWPTLQLCFHSNSICLPWLPNMKRRLILEKRKKIKMTSNVGARILIGYECFWPFKMCLWNDIYSSAAK